MLRYSLTSSEKLCDSLRLSVWLATVETAMLVLLLALALALPLVLRLNAVLKLVLALVELNNEKLVDWLVLVCVEVDCDNDVCRLVSALALKLPLVEVL